MKECWIDFSKWCVGIINAALLRSADQDAGVTDKASANFALSSSLGDTVYTLRSTCTGFVLSPRFWHETNAVHGGCLLYIDGNNSINAVTDGLMLLRAVLGLTGTKKGSCDLAARATMHVSGFFPSTTDCPMCVDAPTDRQIVE